MTSSKPAEPRELPFEHEGHRFRVTADPTMNGYALALWKDGTRVQGLGLASWNDITDAAKSGFHADLIGGAMETIRDAVVTEIVRDPEPQKSDNGN